MSSGQEEAPVGATHDDNSQSAAANSKQNDCLPADIEAMEGIEFQYDALPANQSEAAADSVLPNLNEVVEDLLAHEDEAASNSLANQSVVINNNASTNQNEATDSTPVDEVQNADSAPTNPSQAADNAPSNQINDIDDTSQITDAVNALINQSVEADNALVNQNEAANHSLANQESSMCAASSIDCQLDIAMAEIKTEAASVDVSASSNLGDSVMNAADVEESEAARQAASWIEDASEAADVNNDTPPVAVPKSEPVAPLEAKSEPTDAIGAAIAADRKPQVGLNGGTPASPSNSQPCSSSASVTQATIPGLSKTIENSLTRRQRHDLELIGSCPRCEKFREQIVFDENNEPQPGTNILPDYLADGLDMVVIGINPSITSAYVGHHYAGPGNHFWSCLTESGLIAEPLTCHDDHRICEFGIGFTNVCTRPTKGAADLTRKEMKEGAEILLTKLKKFKPKIAVFNGKGIYEAFVGNKNFYMGKQPEPLVGTDIVLFVMPSSSARCAQLPRAADKLPFYTALKKLRDYVVGVSSHLNDADVVFTDYTEMRVTQPDPKSVRKAERRRKRKAELAQLNQAAAEKARAEAAAVTAAASASSATAATVLVVDSKEAVQAKISAIQQQQLQQQQQQQLQQQVAQRGVKVEATAMPQQYALLAQQPGHYEWQIYQPTLYYQLAANPADPTGGNSAAAAAYLRPQFQILQTADAAAAVTAAVDGGAGNSAAAAAAAAAQQLGFANLLLLDPSQLQAAAAAATSGAATVTSSVALVSSAVTTVTSQDGRQQQQQHQMTYTTL